METQVEKFDPSKLMEGVRDRIKATFVSLIPEEQWLEMIQKEVTTFFKEQRRTRYTNNELWTSDFSDVVHEELLNEAKNRMIAYLSSPEFEDIWTENGIKACKEAVSKMIVDNAGAIMISTFGGMFCEMLARFKSNLLNGRGY